MIMGNHHGHTRPDHLMGRRKRRAMSGGPPGLRNSSPTSAQNRVEKQRAARKRPQRDRSAGREE